MYDVVIIGAGPAGLSAAIYAKRAGLDAVTIEKNSISGGQVLNTYEVDNYPGFYGINGFDMGMKFREHADKLECEFKTGTVISIKTGQMENTGEEGFLIETDEEVLYAKTVVAAMGAVHAKLNIPGEGELLGRGVSYCATCDGAFFRGKTTAVIGGGDVAAEDAIFLARACKKVYLIHRRDELRAARILQDKVKALPNVEILWNTVAETVEGQDHVEGLYLKDVKTGESKKIDVDGVFIAVGIIPDSSILKEVADCDEKGYVIAGEDCVCNTPGIFAAGDVRTKKLRQIVTAAADGANAIHSVQEYLLHCSGMEKQIKITK